VRRLQNELAAAQAALEVVTAGNGETIEELTNDLRNARVDSATLKKELSTLQEEKEKEGLFVTELERNLAGQTSEIAALRQELEVEKARESRMRDVGVTEKEEKDAELKSLKQELDVARGGILVLEKRLALQVSDFELPLSPDRVLRKFLSDVRRFSSGRASRRIPYCKI
jgi:predicted RNase H-like nuclease (RuvC/YqgF family)